MVINETLFKDTVTQNKVKRTGLKFRIMSEYYLKVGNSITDKLPNMKI